MEFVKTFGLDWWLIYAQAVNFGILIIVLSVFLYKPIMEEFRKERERRKRLEDDEVKNEARRKQMDADLARARDRARAIIDEAEDIATDIKRKTREETQSEKRAILSQYSSKARMSHQELRENGNVS